MMLKLITLIFCGIILDKVFCNCCFKILMQVAQPVQENKYWADMYLTPNHSTFCFYKKHILLRMPIP